MGQIPGAVEFGASFAELSDPSELSHLQVGPLGVNDSNSGTVFDSGSQDACGARCGHFLG